MLIQNLLNQSEGQTLEFSKDLPSREELAKIICAFSNTSGGKLILGVNPETKDILGVNKAVIFELRSTFHKMMRDIIEPLPPFELKVLSVDELKLIEISILPGNLKPYFLKGTDKYTGTYIRKGKENVIAESSLVNELDRQSLGICYDSLPYYDAVVEDLNTKLIEKYNELKSKQEKSSKPLINYAFMERNGLIIREKGKLFPTIASILCFSDKANTFFPKAKVNCKVYDYEDTTKLNALKTFSGPLFSQLEEAFSFLADNDIPGQVIQELVVNAFVHRDYTLELDAVSVSLFSNRLEIFSPGYIPANTTLEEVLNGVSVVRNKLLYKIFSDMGFCCTPQSGLCKANQILKDNNYNLITISGDFNGITFTVYNDLAEDFFTKEEIKILEYLETVEYINNTQCQKLLKVKGKQAQYILTKLARKGRLESIGEKKGRRYLLKES